MVSFLSNYADKTVLTRWGMDRRPLGFPEVSGMGVLAVVPLGPVGCWMGSLWIGLAPAHPADPDRILTWGIWMPGRHTEPFLTFLGPFLDVSCGVAGWRGVCLWQCLDRRYPMNARAQGCPVEHCMLHTSPVSHSNVVAHSLLKIFANMFTTSAQTVMKCQCRVLHLFQLPQGVPKISYSSSTQNILKW